jgi:C4-dicarboxylate-specific signal transduction histidine kinase
MQRPGGRVFVIGDRVRLCQVVPNLLTNACKYATDFIARAEE